MIDIILSVAIPIRGAIVYTGSTAIKYCITFTLKNPTRTMRLSKLLTMNTTIPNIKTSFLNARRLLSLLDWILFYKEK